MRIPIKNKNQGFSLMEVLIAMIIIAVGLLGYMALQLASINSNQDGMARSQAIYVSQELASAIRANREYSFQSGGLSEYLKAENYMNCDEQPICTGPDGTCLAIEQALTDTWQACQTINGFTVGPGETNDDLLLNGEIRVGCSDRDTIDGDLCSPGSALTIYTFWANGAKRTDVGQIASVNSQVANTRCSNFAADAANQIVLSNLGDEVDCLVLDVMP